MTVPPLRPPFPAAPPDRFRRLPWVLSALLHLAAWAAWTEGPSSSPAGAEPAVVVEIAPLPPPAAPPAPPRPPGEDRPPETRPIPQLREGVLAERSNAPSPEPSASPPFPSAGRGTAAKPPPVTQNERDFILSQVLRHWTPPRDLAAYEDADVAVAVTVEGDGFFAGAYDARRPWQPGAVFDGYERLHPQDIQRRVVDAFYRAIRQAQPLRLPPALRAKAPFTVRLDFRFRDVRR